MLSEFSFIVYSHFDPETASLNKKAEIYKGCKHKQFKFKLQSNIKSLENHPS